MFFRQPDDPNHLQGLDDARPAPDGPTEEEKEEALATIAQGMFDLRSSLAPAFDAADGMRTDLLRRGWNPESAEIICLTWLQRTVANLTPLIGSPQ